jgi:hypothetical protein
MNSYNKKMNESVMSISDVELKKISAAVTDDCSVTSYDGSAKLLQDGSELSSYDVICGRGKGCSNWVGNRRFRVMIAMYKERYLQAPTRIAKSAVLENIFQTVQASSPPTRFVRKDQASTGRWYEIRDDEARNKVGHAMRDAIGADEKKTYRHKNRKSKAKEAINAYTSLRRISALSDDETAEEPQSDTRVTEDFLPTLLDELGAVLDEEDDKIISALFSEPVFQLDTLSLGASTNMEEI